jgi:hypothetical protein
MAFDTDKFLSVLVNSSHLAIATLCQGSILVAHWCFHRDLSLTVQQTVSWFYALLAGHFASSQIWPDKGGQ